MSITEFLTARYDEDEAQARSAIDNRMRANIHPSDKGTQTFGPVDISDDSDLGDMSIGAEYVLADVAAKRAIVSEIETTRASARAMPGGSARLAVMHGLDMMERHLLQPYAEHPDFDESWKP